MADLTAGQQRAIDALLASPDLTKAAKAAGINRDTLRLWLRNPDFRTAYQEAQRETRQQAIRYVSSAMIRAAQSLVSSLSNPKLPPATRAYLSIKTLELGLRLQSSEDLEGRISRLERYFIEWSMNHGPSPGQQPGAPFDQYRNGSATEKPLSPGADLL